MDFIIKETATIPAFLGVKSKTKSSARVLLRSLIKWLDKTCYFDLPIPILVDNANIKFNILSAACWQI